MKGPKRLSRRDARTIFGVAFGLQLFALTATGFLPLPIFAALLGITASAFAVVAVVRALKSRGTKSSVTVAAEPQLAPVHETSSVVEAKGPFRILVVEDNVINQQVVTMHLRRLGYRYETVGNGLEAVKAISSKKYDLILMDCHMPDMDGFEAVREIRRLEQGERNKIIAMTANAPRGEHNRCLASGMDDYLAKPIDDRALKAALQKWLAASEAASDLTARRQRAA